MRFRNFNPEMLTLARLSRGRSQTWFAENLGISAGLMSKWENGIVEPQPERIEQVADRLGYPSSLFFQTERVRGTDSICFHHRKRKTMPARLLSQVEAEMHLAQLQAARLLQHVRIKATNEFLTLDPDDVGGPHEVARVVRAYWRIPTGPVPSMVTLVEAAGAVVVLRDFRSRKLDGMSAWGKGTPPLFFLNEANPVDRNRWTIAHELGHLIMHRVATSGDPEDEANLFAQELLIPRDEVIADLRRLSFARLPALKAYWRVSMKALITTADKLGVLPKNKIKSMYVQYSRAGWSQGEPHSLTPEKATVLAKAIQVHLGQHGYSIPELASVVHLSTKEFSEKYDLPVGRDQQRLRIV